jgi:hypothetical protein
MSIDERVAVLETKMEGVCGDTAEQELKLDRLIEGQVRIEEHLENGLGGRIAERLEEIRAAATAEHDRKRNWVLGVAGTVFVALQTLSMFI